MNNLSNVLEDYSHCNLMGYDLKTLHRLWSRIIIPKDYENDCWLWTAGTDADGYGHIYISENRYRSPRVIYECYNGPIPDGLIIRHTYDNPPCVSPYHLKIGTQYDNIHDAIDRGRFAYGENNGRALLTEDDVKDILNYLWKGNISCAELGKMYNVDSVTINLISLGKNWKKIYNKLTKEQKEKIRFNVKHNNNSSLTPDQVKQIKELHITTNMKQIELAKMFGVVRQVIYKITTGKSWKHIK